MRQLVVLLVYFHPCHLGQPPLSPPTAAMTLATKMILIFLCMEVTFFITGLRSIRSGSHMFLKASPYNHVKVKPFSMTMTSMGLDYKLWNLPASR